MKITRETVDLSAFPDLVVIYLGMRVHSLKGMVRFLKIGPAIQNAVAEKPDGLLLHENLIFGLLPPHVGMRQYWRDFASMEKWSRAMPHQAWWKDFLKNPGGTGFWHETYLRRGGMESVFDNMSETPLGFMNVGTRQAAKGPMFQARDRVGIGGVAAAPVVREEDT